MVCEDTFREYGSSAYMTWKLSGQGHGHRSKESQNFLYPQCKTLNRAKVFQIRLLKATYILRLVVWL